MKSQVWLFVLFVLRIRDVAIWYPGLESFNPERILLIFFQYLQRIKHFIMQ